MSQAGVEENSSSGSTGGGGGGGDEPSQSQSVSDVGDTTSPINSELDDDKDDSSSSSSFALVSPDADKTKTSPSAPDGNGADPFAPDANGTSPFAPGGNGTDPFAPDANGTSPFAPDASGIDPFAPDANGTPPFAPDANGTSPFAPEGNGSFPYAPEADDSFSFTPDDNRSSPFAPDSNRSSTIEPDADKSSQLLAESDGSAPETPVLNEPCERESESEENNTPPITLEADDHSSHSSGSRRSFQLVPDETEENVQLIPESREKSPSSPEADRSSGAASDSDEDKQTTPAIFGSSDFELEVNGSSQPEDKESSPFTAEADEPTLISPEVDNSPPIVSETAVTTLTPPEVEEAPEIVAKVGKSTQKAPEINKPATPQPDAEKDTQVTPEPTKTTQIVPDTKQPTQHPPETNTTPPVSREINNSTQLAPESFQYSKLTPDSNGSPNHSTINVDDYPQHTTEADESTLLLIPSDDNEPTSPSTTSGTTASAPRSRSSRIPIPGCLDKKRIMATSLEDITSLRLWKGIIAEFVGVLLLVLVGCGSCISLDPNSSSSVVQIALCFGLSVATIVWNIGHISGGHINPAVTLALLATRKISLAKAIFFVLFQLVGSVVGAGILMGLTPEEYQGGLGNTLVNKNLDAGKGFGVELFITFVLVFTVFASIDSKRRDLNGSTPLTVGLSVTMCHLFAVQYTGASMNTARSFGPALVTGNWENHWVYWLGPIGGGLIAGLLYEYLFAVNASLNKVRACVLSSDYDNDKIQAKKIKVRIVEEDPEAPGENLSLTQSAEKQGIEEQ